MLYDLIAFKSYICFDFQNLSIYDLYMYYYWPIHLLTFCMQLRKRTELIM
jgi:hypothetical protein